jgi:pimeloyl-ACP methyl ester carboxylesterase
MLNGFLVRSPEAGNAGRARGRLVHAAVATALVVTPIAPAACQNPALGSVDEKVLREYAGAYQWEQDAFLYLQLWNEFTGKNQLVSFDESGEVRTLFSTDRDRFFTGPGAAVTAPVESRVEFQRDASGKITSLTSRRGAAATRVARRVDIERREDLVFSNGAIQLAGTLITPATRAKYPAIILVHGSGPGDRESMLPFARFLIRHGIAVLGYDKRGVGGSTGDWNTASFDDLAGDVVAAFEYLKKRDDIDSGQIGLLGVSQAGWIMPLAAVKAKNIAFLISISGAGISASETTIDQAQNEMTARGMKPETVEQIVQIMKLQYHFARTGQGWNEYAAARDKLAARVGRPPDTYPGTPDHPYWGFIRRLYFYDPVPTLGRLQVPTLALFGELDNNILAAKNKLAWDSALRVAGNPDYTSVILPRANHIQLEAKVGSNAEMPSLQRFVPEYFTTVHNWLAKRVRGFGASR